MKKLVTSAFLLLGILSVHGQYMSFFGDSTWEYRVTYITQPPEDYLNTPPQEPNQLGVYCVTFSYRFQKNHHPSYGYGTENEYMTVFDINQDFADYLLILYEDTVHGRLYQDYGMSNTVICDMSLSEGDTFVLDHVCSNSAPFEDPNDYYPWDSSSLQLSYDIYMLVDSVWYSNGRKVISLSLIDHQDDYFFGTGDSNLLSDYNLSIRFIEGIGPTYGLRSNCEYPATLATPMEIGYYYFYPWLPLLQCMYKDDSLVYLAHEDLECVQTCMGDNSYFWEDVPALPLPVVNLYPNPATQYVVLDLSTGEEMNGVVTITDMLGRVCVSQKAERTKCQIAVSDLPTGMYFLTYSDGERKVTRKFMKK